MQLVNTIDIPFENHHPVDRKVRAVGDMLLREIAGIWHRFREALSMEPAAQRLCAAPDVINLPGYYGGAYQRLSAAMPIVSYAGLVEADPFPQASTSRRKNSASEKLERAPRPSIGDDIWLGILRADPAIPARMM